MIPLRCIVDRKQIPEERVRRGAKTCDKECQKVFRRAFLLDRKERYRRAAGLTCAPQKFHPGACNNVTLRENGFGWSFCGAQSSSGDAFAQAAGVASCLLEPVQAQALALSRNEVRPADVRQRRQRFLPSVAQEAGHGQAAFRPWDAPFLCLSPARQRNRSAHHSAAARTLRPGDDRALPPCLRAPAALHRKSAR